MLKNCQELFGRPDQFDSFQELVDYVEEGMNKDSKIEEEMKYLKPYQPPYEIGQIQEKRVNKYAFVIVDKNDYSVPEEYTGGMVTVKFYPQTVEIFYKGNLIAKHERLEGRDSQKVEIEHYYNIMLRKPGTVRYSLALRQAPQLKKIFDKYYTKNPKQFLYLNR